MVAVSRQRAAPPAAQVPIPMRGTSGHPKAPSSAYPASIISTTQAGVAGMLADLFARNASIRQCAVWGLPQARKRLAIGKPAGETVSKFIQHDRLLWRAECPRAWVGRKRKASARSAVRSKGLRCLLGQPRRLSLSRQAGLSTPPMPAYLRVMPASRYSPGRKEFFISAKWISAGTI